MHADRISLLGCGLAATALLVSLRADQEPQRASRFELVDETGRVRAALALHEGAPRLTMNDADGNERVLLLHDAGSTGLYLKDADGQPRVGAVHFAHGGSGFALHGAGGKGAAVLYFMENGSLRLFDEEGTTRYEVNEREARHRAPKEPAAREGGE